VRDGYRRHLPLTFWALSLAFAPAPGPKPARPTAADVDLKAMQGHWVRTSFYFGGTRMVAGDGNVRVGGNKAAFYLGTRLRDEWAISLKPEKGTKRFEARAISGDRKGRTIRGTYRLDGDVLTLSYEEAVGPGGSAWARPNRLPSSSPSSGRAPSPPRQYGNANSCPSPPGPITRLARTVGLPVSVGDMPRPMALPTSLNSPSPEKHSEAHCRHPASGRTTARAELVPARFWGKGEPAVVMHCVGMHCHIANHGVATSRAAASVARLAVDSPCRPA
jgi:uncharacterized protein (TIGR03067 family)